MISTFYNLIIRPTSQDEDIARREVILHVLLACIIVLTTTALALVLYSWLGLRNVYVAPRFAVIFCIWLFFIGLHYASIRGHIKIVSIIFVSALFLIATATILMWGFNLASGLLIYSLIVIMAGVVVGTSSALVMATITVITLLAVAFLQSGGVMPPRAGWAARSLTMHNAIVYAIILAITAVISWLSNREIDRSLTRARRSEAALRKERDLLEVTVEARTKELRESQLERMIELYRFAEFGRLASEVFHDLSSPLMTVSVSLSALKKNDSRSKQIERALEGTKRMEQFIESARKQIQQEDVLEEFHLYEETQRVLDIISHKAKKLGVRLEIVGNKRVSLRGNPLKFHKIATNLISNAIDSYDGVERKNRRVIVGVEEKGGSAVVRVQDWGSGIAEDNVQKVFVPFFTTKKPDRGMGLGLWIVKNIVSKDFRGEIKVISKRGEGTTFTMHLRDAVN